MVVLCESTLYRREIDDIGNGMIRSGIGKHTLAQIHLFKVNAELGKAAHSALALYNPDNAVERIIRLSGDREQCVARTKQSEKSDRQRVCAGSNAVTDKCRLCAEHLCIYLIESISALVVIAITGRGSKMRFAYAMALKCLEHLFGAYGRDPIDFCEMRSKRCLRLISELFKFFGNNHLYKSPKLNIIICGHFPVIG